MSVLIADRHALITDLLSRRINDAWPGVHVLTAGSVGEALTVANDHPNIDAALIDTGLSGMGDLQGLSRFLQNHPNVRTGVLSDHVDRTLCRKAYRLGAAGCFAKSEPAEALLSFIAPINAGAIHLPTLIQTSRDDLVLTGREAQVLEGLWQGKSNREIADGLGVREVTVKMHLRRLYRTLDCRNRTEAVRIGLERGLLARSA